MGTGKKIKRTREEAIEALEGCCIEMQNDIRHGKFSSFKEYFRKWRIGNPPSHFFNGIEQETITREFATTLRKKISDYVNDSCNRAKKQKEATQQPQQAKEGQMDLFKNEEPQKEKEHETRKHESDSWAKQKKTIAVDSLKQLGYKVILVLGGITEIN